MKSQCAGSGQLTTLIICTMNLTHTWCNLACSLSSGHAISGEPPINLAHVFCASGTHTVIGTLWSVSDKAFASFLPCFTLPYAIQVSISELSSGKTKTSMQQDAEFNHWFNWAPYVCLGTDFPLFSTL